MSVWQIELFKMSTEMELEIVAYLKETLVEAPSSGHQRLKEGCNFRTGTQTARQTWSQPRDGERGREGVGEVETTSAASCKLLVQFAVTWKRQIRPTER